MTAAIVMTVDQAIPEMVPEVAPEVVPQAWICRRLARNLMLPTHSPVKR